MTSRDKQQAISDGEDYEDRLQNYNGSEVEHHDDIFEVEKSSRDCDLCDLIFQAFKRNKARNIEVARGLQITLRAFRGQIEVCCEMDNTGGLTKLCGLDMYMDEVDGEYLFTPNNCSGTHLSRQSTSVSEFVK